MTKTISGQEMLSRLLKNVTLDIYRPVELQNNHFMLYRKRVQRKTGGHKNKWVIAVKFSIDFTEVLNDALAIMKSFGGEDYGHRSMIFKRYADAEKAWVYLTLRWS